MADDKIKVLYIAGCSRSGSTILGNILGQIDGFFNVGELRYIWRLSFIENWLCGCGARFRDCEVWKAILKEAFGRIDHIDADEMLRLCESGTRTRHLPLMLMPGGKSLLAARSSRYLANLEKLYRAIQSTTGCKVIVDSSKLPSYAHTLGMVPAIDLHIAHLIRDPRAVAYSWGRKKFYPDLGADMLRHAPFRSSLLWGVWNILTGMLPMHRPNRYLRLQYENFIDRPQEAISHILELVQERAPKLPFVGDHEVELGIHHTVFGNPNRFQSGLVKLRPDNEWRSKMKRRDRLIVTAITWPLLLLYGYLAKTDTAH